MTDEALLGEGEVLSYVGRNGFKIGGKVGHINPLTGETIIKSESKAPHSISAALEIEVWQIEMES